MIWVRVGVSFPFDKEPEMSEIGTAPSISLQDPTLEDLAHKYLCKGGKRKSPGFKRKLQQLTEVDQRHVILRVESLGLCIKGDIQIQGTVEEKTLPPIARANGASNGNVSNGSNGNGDSSRAVIRWTDTEWDKVIGVLRELRRTKPAPALTSLSDEAQEMAGLPTHRRRRNLQPLAAVVERMLAFEKKAGGLTPRRVMQDEIDLLKMELEERPTKEQLIESLSDEELKPHMKRLLSNLSMNQVLAHFTPEEILRHIPVAKLLPAVAGIFTEGLTAFGATMASISEALAETKAPVIVAPSGGASAVAQKSDRQQLLRITVLGPNNEQGRVVKEHFEGRAKVNVINKQSGAGKITKDMIPASSDLVVLWARFANHADRAAIKAKQKSASFFFREIPDGGVESLIRHIEEALQVCNEAMKAAA